MGSRVTKERGAEIAATIRAAHAAEQRTLLGVDAYGNPVYEGTPLTEAFLADQAQAGASQHINGIYLDPDDPGPNEPPPPDDDPGRSRSRQSKSGDKKQRGKAQDDEPPRKVSLIPLSKIKDDVAEWAWKYGDHGRIQRDALTLFAGRPSAGKSTAAKHFAAGFSQGTLDGCWLNKPQNVAYISTEESDRFIVKPGLRAAGATLDRITLPKVNVGDKHVRLLPITDEDALTALLVAEHVSVVIVDPLMATFGGAVDIHRNNEVRECLEPWQRIAQRINGIVIGVVHLVKSPNGDVLAAITGSSAFGEVARCIFGFAKDPDSEDGGRVISQIKNNAGREDLSITYTIDTHQVRTDSGKVADVGRFIFGDDSDRSVSDILRTNQVAEGLRGHMLDIFEFVVTSPFPVSPKEVAEALNLDNDKAGKYLRRLDEKQLIVKTDRGLYQSRAKGNCPKSESPREDTDE
jgi:predicted ATP-dependent serine protease